MNDIAEADTAFTLQDPFALQIVAEDPAFIVLNKPSGLLCVPGRGEDKQDCLSRRAQERWPEALIVHRLDQPTSGLVVLARSVAVQRQLGHAFSERAVFKRYQALVQGHPLTLEATADTQGWQRIELPVTGDWERRPLQIVDFGRGKPSLTHWRSIAQGIDEHGSWSRLELHPLTGRTHQLRVHLQAIGHPIWGDALYSPPETQQRSPRLCLHACRLGFTHPESKQWQEFSIPAPF